MCDFCLVALIAKEQWDELYSTCSTTEALANRLLHACARLSGILHVMQFRRKTREGWNCQFQKMPRTEGGDKVQGSVDQRFSAGLPFPASEILEFGDGKSLSIAKNDPKPSQELSERFGPFIDKIKGFSRNSPQKVHANFARNLGRQILGNTFSGPQEFIQKSFRNPCP